jgi:hypothetical protein
MVGLARGASSNCLLPVFSQRECGTAAPIGIHDDGSCSVDHEDDEVKKISDTDHYHRPTINQAAKMIR